MNTPCGESILDLIISVSPGFFISSGTLSPLANCGHNIVLAILNCRSYKPKSFKRKVWNFNDIDSCALNNALLDANWDEIFCVMTDDVDELYEQFSSLFLSIVESFIPHKNVTIPPRDKPWMTSEIRRAIRKRDRLLKVYSRVRLSDYKFSAISISPAKTNLFSPWTLHLYTQSFLIAKVFKHLNTFSINALSKNLARKRSSALPN